MHSEQFSQQNRALKKSFGILSDSPTIIVWVKNNSRCLIKENMKSLWIGNEEVTRERFKVGQFMGKKR